ncbi:dihydroxyacetone kinase subunit DhaK [Enterobacter mori]
MSRFFFNDRKQLVNDAIEGILISAPHGNLVKLDVDPAIRIVARGDWDKSRVAVISGGGSGHEPAHAGFVGKGMLTAAVCGDLFASPSVDAVLNAIVAVTGDRGCLLIVKNYTGDRLNFGLAAEKAKRYGLKVEMVIVADDIALPDNKQPRGIAGTALVHKIAGYAAEHGKSLSEVRDIAQQACDNLWSLGVAMQTCNLPGSDEEEGRIKQGHVELGLGIHGEPGASVVDTQNSKAIIDTLVTPLKTQAGEGRFAVLINNLGGVSALEMALLTKELAHSALKENIAYLIGPAPLVSALDAKVGDGDTGSTFAQGARDIAQRLEEHKLPLNDVSTLLLLVGERLATVMGGSSGVLMSIFFTAAGQKLHDGQPLPEALLSGLAQMKQYGGADLGDRTLIDALQPALEALQKKDLQSAAQAAQQGAEATAKMEKAGAGRSSYVNKENLDGVMDPGAVAVAEVFKAMVEAKR